jgi:hypothetical protein
MNNRIKTFTRRCTLILTILFAAGLNRGCTNTESKSHDQQLNFASPDEAVDSLIAALRMNDKKKLEEIFGPGSDDLVASGDDTADQFNRQRALDAYDQKHELVKNADGSMTLNIGEQDWPMPIPLVKDEKSKKWVFDTDAGMDEIINRRIGRNELDVIEVCKAVGDAQREYATQDHNSDGIPEYARKFVSDDGQKNGLYWPTKEGEPQSPLGALAAEAQGQGYKATANPTGEPRPYHGYYYRMLTAQGKDASGGARSYEVNGKLIGGYAVIAWPADYGSSGIMTFISNYEGDVYQKDLGDDTDKLARAMNEYNPDSSWKKCEDEKAATGG